MALKSTKTADSSFATADLLDAIKDLDTIECGVEARKHFNLAPSYRNLNHGMLSMTARREHNTDFGLHVRCRRFERFLQPRHDRYHRF